jgi:hypothetical protein
VGRNLQIRESLACQCRDALRNFRQPAAVDLEMTRAPLFNGLRDGRTACADGGRLAQSGQGIA